MKKLSITFLLSILFFSIPVLAQTVTVKGDSEAAQQARNDLQKYTSYRLADDAHGVLVVDKITWSPDFLSPVSHAIQMTLFSPRGSILWQKTESVGSRPPDAVVADLLKDLAKARPDFRAQPKAPSTSTPGGGTPK